MNPLKENQKINIIPDKINQISAGTIVSLEPDCFVAKIDNPLSIKSGQEHEIMISLEDCKVLFSSKANKVENDNVVFSIPAKFSFIQKREYPRVNTNLPVFLSMNPQNPETEGTILNIGGGGMQVASLSKYTVGSILTTRFNLSDKKQINTFFEVLRSEEKDGRFFISGKFSKISNIDKTSIVQFCFKRLLESKCKR